MATEKQFGERVEDYFLKSRGRFPSHETISGRHVNLLPLSANHAAPLFEVIGGTQNNSLFDYMPYGPFTDLSALEALIAGFSESKDPQFYTIVEKQSNRIVGYISFLHIEPTQRVIEIGHVMFARSLQRTTAATEAIYLLARKAFEDGFRRLEWRCNAFNEPSRRAALRFGYVFEGVLRQHSIVKGRNRDTAMLSILDKEWPVCQKALEKWMVESNFDAGGRQKRDLVSLRGELERGAA